MRSLGSPVTDTATFLQCRPWHVSTLRCKQSTTDGWPFGQQCRSVRRELYRLSSATVVEVSTMRMMPASTFSPQRETRVSVFVVVVVLTLTHNTIQSVVAGQAPITLEWTKYLGIVLQGCRVFVVVLVRKMNRSAENKGLALFCETRGLVARADSRRGSLQPTRENG